MHSLVGNEIGANQDDHDRPIPTGFADGPAEPHP
jgi:hypothetical protein